MYKAVIRAMVRKQIDQLNQGDYAPILAMAAPDAELAFPGDNSWSRQFRAPQASREQWTTHRGKAELEAFAERFVATGLRLDVEDILVNGPPWNTRIWVRATDRALDDAGRVVYENRVVACMDTRWGRIHRWEDYLDTERITAWDRATATVGAG